MDMTITTPVRFAISPLLGHVTLFNSLKISAIHLGFHQAPVLAASNSETGRPLPMPADEVEQLIKEEELGQATFNIGFEVGESVLVIDGPFSDMLGEVDSIDTDRGRVRVMVSMFGREPPVDLDFLQVEKQ